MKISIRALTRTAEGRPWRVVVDGKATDLRIRPATENDGAALASGQFVIECESIPELQVYMGEYRFHPWPQVALESLQRYPLTVRAGAKTYRVDLDPTTKITLAGTCACGGTFSGAPVSLFGPCARCKRKPLEKLRAAIACGQGLA